MRCVNRVCRGKEGSAVSNHALTLTHLVHACEVVQCVYAYW